MSGTFGRTPRAIDPVQDVERHIERKRGVRSQGDLQRDIDRTRRSGANGIRVGDADSVLASDVTDLRLTGSGVTLTTEGTKVTASITGGSGGTITVQEGDVTVDSAAGTLDFDASDFNVTSSPSGEANISLAYGTTAGTPAEGNHTHAGVYADASHTHAASDINSGTIATARLGSGTADNTTFLRGDQTWATPAGGSGALDDLSDVAITAAAEGEAVTHNGTSFIDAMHVNFTLGPFYLANPTASGSDQQMRLGVPTSTTTSFNQTTNDIEMQRSGRIIGAILVSNAARTGGTLTARARINGVGADIGSGGCVLDATNTTSDSVFVGYVNGAAFSGGDTIGMAVTGSSWAPTTADVTGWLVVQLIAHTG